MKIDRGINRRIYLIKCKSFGILTKHIQGSLITISNLLWRQRIDFAEESGKKLSKRLGFNLLMLEIYNVHNLIRKVESQLKSYENFIILKVMNNYFQAIEEGFTCQILNSTKLVPNIVSNLRIATVLQVDILTRR